ncbi:MAG: hypothetical protein K6T34_06375 [Thermoflavifilum sp.]|nr:hypothetical protein [Thermoflavifilum sp.]
MKKIPFLFIAIVTLGLWGMQSHAQGRMSPEERAKSFSQRMEQQISGLTDQQKDSIEAINLDISKAMQAAFEQNQGDREAMRSAMQSLQQQRDERLRAILNDDQYKQYQDMMQNMRRNFRRNDNGGGSNR